MRINRRAVVDRHMPTLTAPHAEHVLSVGNGDFAYTADITGMQTFTAFHDPTAAVMSGGVAVNTATMSNWGWHTMPNPEGYVLNDAMSEYDTARGPVRYPDRFDLQAASRGQVPEDERAGEWLHTNPQRMDLGRIGFELRSSPDAPPLEDPHALKEPRQRLDLWRGIITSSFVYDGSRITVETVAAMDTATVAFRVRGDALRDGRAKIRIAFPYPHSGFFQTSDWGAEDRHQTTVKDDGEGAIRIDRTVDEDRYSVLLRLNGGRVIASNRPHVVLIEAEHDVFELVATFHPAVEGSADSLTPPRSFAEVKSAATSAWKQFWGSGAALDLAGSDDPRASELERRLILSQYLTRVHSAGMLPPQETGFVTNSWSGKFHLEMHFWHAAHFAAWGRPELLTPSLDWYRDVLDVARGIAAEQGLPGARWPKQVGPDGRESPDPTGPLLIWQQPHVLYLLELAYRASPADEQLRLLSRFAEVVHDTATFMAAFPTDNNGELHLGSPVMPAQEFYDAKTTADPTFELAYWWWGLEIAQRWRERQDIGREPHWSDAQRRLVKPRVQNGKYVPVGTSSETRRDDHPALLGALGMVPSTPLVRRDLMESTLQDVLAHWDWPTAWGWDYPMMAMTATRLGRPDVAMNVLLQNEPRNSLTLVGHGPQIGGILPIYLPSNGALLAAVSLMVTAAEHPSDGFPASGWKVAAEGFVPWP
ncbi:hypothetical protein DEJ27_12190 [Curtobacterium sp. MCPF17_018]|uniref:hypothetical protein n=1 Tax=Curtobacterium sp. MCPF17_018 TaxID=2175638 RepID=UPI000DA77437|nr:hypothetical protein [Curtobacterium sp. MCPF17_018]PZE67377.1 hypothetical protein DEJ27_12190 [Curtobacterium sp. MCPF17_018]